MKWNKRNNWGPGYLGQGYESGEYIIEETTNYYELAKENGGKQKDYWWVLRKNEEPIKYASTAKALKQYAEDL